jgi:type II secretory pathway pseudopilin PulG
MRKAERGFTYVALLFAVAIIGVGLAAKGVEWDRTAQRAREAELLFVGNEFRKAIALYYYRSPGPAQEYPRSLEELLEDPRYPGTQRYLRRIYRDPMTGKPEWGLVVVGGQIVGVHSLSPGQPIKSGNFSEANRDFASKTSYAEWRFTFSPPVSSASPAVPGVSAR